MPFQLRVATAADVVEIRKLIVASVRGLQVEYTREAREAAISTVFSIDSQLIADGTYYIAVAEDGRAAGCGGWSRRKTLYGGDHQIEAIESAVLDPVTDAAKIRAIFVHPDYARRGLGTILLTMAENAAKAEGFARLEMGSTLAGERLYRLKGYTEVSRLEVPVGSDHKITVIRMIKEM